MTDISHARAVAIDRSSTHRFCVVAWRDPRGGRALYHVGRLVDVDGQSYVLACLDPRNGDLHRLASKARAFERAKAIAAQCGGRVLAGLFVEEDGKQSLRPVKLAD